MTKKGFEPSRTRTFAVVGHRSSGKTSLSDVLLQVSGVTRLIGRVDDKTSLLDHTSEAHLRHMTLEPSTAWMSWREHMVSLVDTPGSMDLTHVAENALHQVDGFVCVVAANDGVQHTTRRMLHTADHLGVPGVVVINQMDRAFDLDATIAEIEQESKRRVVLLQLPLLDHEGHFCGVIDLLERHALRYAADGSGALSVEPLPAGMGAQARDWREKVVESIALEDEELLEHYLEYLELPEDEIRAALVHAVQRGDILPVLLSSALHGIGAGPLMDLLVECLPEPSTARRPELDGDGAFVATVLHTSIDNEGRPYTLMRVWGGQPKHGEDLVNGNTGAKSKVRKFFQVRGPRRAVAHTVSAGAILGTWDMVDARPGEVLSNGQQLSTPSVDMPPPMMAYTLSPPDDHQASRLERALPILLRMDHGLESRTTSDGELVLEGRNKGQLDRAMSWLRKRMGVKVESGLPRVEYREAPSQPAQGAEGVHVRAINGLVEEFGKCSLDVAPTTEGWDVSFAATVSGESVPKRFLPAIQQGALAATKEGPMAGYPVVGVQVTCVDGEYDYLQSTEEHFREAGATAMRAALQQSGTRLLEPWSSVVIHAPAEGVGAILADLTAHRARIVDVQVADEAMVQALAPDRENRTLVTRLATLTAGRGWFTSSHSHYDVLPDAFVDEAVHSSPVVRARRARSMGARKVGSA